MELLKYMLISIPMISSMTCGIILIVVFYKNLSVTEIPILRTLGGYYFSLIALWLIDNLTLNLKDGRLILLPLLAVLITLSQVCFYHFICYLIPTKKKFNFFQYKMVLVLFVMSSAFIYVLYKTTGYRQLDFTSFCSSYLTIYVAINVISYTVLCWVQIIQYHKEKAKRKINMKRVNWIHLLLVVKTLFTLLFCFNPQHIVVDFLLVLMLSLQHIILTFNMLQDKNRVKIPKEYKTNIMLSSGQIVSVDQTGAVTVDGIESTFIATQDTTENLLSQQEIAAYFTEHKPYIQTILNWIHLFLILE